MADKPDFIVDPSGNVRNVRNLRYASGNGSAPPHQAATSEHSRGPERSSLSIQPTKSSPGGIIIIPIGLILTLLIAVLRFPMQSKTNNAYSESDANNVNSGMMNYAQGDYQMALIDFNSVIYSNPGMSEAYNGRGLVYDAQGDYNRAIADFGKAIELKPDWAGGYSNRAGSYFAAGEYELALADLDRAIQLDADFGKAYFSRGLLHLAMGNNDAAIADFDKAIESTPELASLLSSYTYLNEQTPGPGRDMMMDISNYHQLLQTGANLPLSYANRGLAYFNKGDFEHSAADLEKALELGLEPSDQ